MKLLPALFLTTTLLSAADVTPWEDVGSAQGDITVTPKNGKKLKRTDKVTFQPADLWFASNTQTIPRSDIKEVVIRGKRQEYDGWLLTGPTMLVYVVLYPKLLPFLPIAVGMAAATGPPWLAWEGIRRLKPAKILYRVVP